jgi:hypothetical protein
MIILGPKKKFKILRALLGVCLFLFVVIEAFISSIPVLPAKNFGVTFSYPYAEQFKLDWKEMYRAILDDLQVRLIRIPVYWSEVSHRQDSFYFNDYDYQVREAQRRQAKIILAVGRKLPRWPECHEAAWANALSDQERQEEILKYIGAVVQRYKNSPALSAWQVENEPFLSFGVCPPLDVDFLDREIVLVKSLDPQHPVIVTDSGELSIWMRAASRADIFGTTMYRTIYKNNIGYVTYPLPPSFFRFKRAITELVVGKRPMIVIELQAESWGPRLVYDMSKAQQYESFNPQKFKETVAYAERTGFDTFYFWGVEWWYWLKMHEHDPAIWDMARALFNG